MNTNYNFQQPSRCLQRCLSLICLLTFLLVGLSGANAQTAISATSTNTNSPLLSANGKIAFASIAQNRYVGIYTMNPDGSDLTRLTSGADLEPAWSPDGTQIAFTRFNGATQGGIFVMNADGSNQRRFTANANDRYPTWSPDGTKIAFSSRFGVIIMNADGSNQRVIQTGDNRYYYQPA